MYGKSYESKFEGSMVGAGVAVFAVWDYMTTKARDGYVEVNPELLAFTLGGRGQDPSEIVAALDYLQRPDPNSRSKSEDGRRIVKEGQFQYRLVNWESYNRIRTEEDRRVYNRHKQAEYRDRERQKSTKTARERVQEQLAADPTTIADRKALRDLKKKLKANGVKPSAKVPRCVTEFDQDSKPDGPGFSPVTDAPFPNSDGSRT